ncbi:MAG: molybdopterin biosynthesis protein, partial [Candidatus Hecatellaceae archaeon]
MKRKIFRELISVEEALKRLLGRVKPLGVEKVPLTEACGRVLAEDVFAFCDVPPFDRAAMDGYATKAENTYGA